MSLNRAALRHMSRSPHERELAGPSAADWGVPTIHTAFVSYCGRMGGQHYSHCVYAV